MANRPALSKAEMEVARIVWDLGGATVRQVHDAMPKSRRGQYKTVQTYLRRLETKGYVSSRRDGRSIVYTARVQPRQVIRETVRDFVTRLFDGQALPLVEHLIQEKNLKRSEIVKLRQLLDELDR